MIIKCIIKHCYVIVALILLSVNYAALAANDLTELKHEDQVQRIITTDWSIAETLLTLNAPVVGIGDSVQYNNWVVIPRIPDEVIDLGLRSQPNMEALINSNANTLINSSWFQKILPPELIDNRYSLHAIDFYTNEGLSWQNAVDQTQQLAKITSREAEANHLISQVESSFQVNSTRIEAFRDRPIAIVQFIDSRHLRIYGSNSLYGVVLNKLNLHNAWQQKTNGWGFQQITLLDLANLPSSTLLIVIAPYPVNLEEKLAKNSVWLQLPFVKQENYRVLPAIWAFGALPSIQRFSDILTDSLLQPEHYFWQSNKERS